MPRSKAVRDPSKALVNHEELRALVRHLSALIAALDVRLQECERVLAVDPKVGELAADFLKRIKGEAGDVVRNLALVEDNICDVSEPGMAIDGIESPEMRQSIDSTPMSVRGE